MLRSNSGVLLSLVVVAATPVAARLFLQSSGAATGIAAAALVRRSDNGTGKKDERPGTADHAGGNKPEDGKKPAGGNKGADSNKDPDANSPKEYAERGRKVGREELGRNIEGFCKEYAKTPPPGQELACPETDGRRLHAAIAILPDPVHTHLALRFDRGIDDIEDAMESLGWTFDHSWLPWDNKVYAASDRYEEREADSAEQRAREENPGVLFFRGPDVQEPQSELMVLVVGDTPTAGVNPKQFHGAMETWKGLVRSESIDPGELAILGPTFSGSVQSLRHLLNKELGAEAASGQDQQGCDAYEPPRVDIASGTVTSADRMVGLEALTDACGHLVASYATSFGIDSAYQTFELIHFLKKHIHSERIIRLSEAESSFGADSDKDPGVANDLWGALASATCAPRMSDCEQQRKRQEAVMVDDHRQQWERSKASEVPELAVQTLHFPREISSLRKAYEQNSIVGFGSTSNSPRTQLSLSEAEDTHDDDDTVATFSGEQSTLAMETEMSLIATKLSSERYDVVLLSATDMLDEIFVARYLQQHAPKLTVIVEDADLMFLRSGEDAGLNDLYVATPWPLEDARPQLFQSQSDEGLHNAAAYLISRLPRMDGETAAKPYRDGAAELFDYGPPVLPPGMGGAAAVRPPLWLAVIGHGQYYPIALVDVDQMGAGLPEAGDLNLPAPAKSAMGGSAGAEQAGLDGKTVIPAVKLAAALIGLLLVWHGAALFWARLDRRFAWTYALAEAEHRPYRLGLQALVSACAIPALGLLWLPRMEGLSAQHGAFRAILIALQVLAALLATWPALRWFCGEVPHPGRRRVLLKTLAVLVGLGALIFVADRWLWSWIAPGYYTERLFFLYRNTQLLCGSSPALTLGLLLGAMVFRLHSQFGRLAFFGHRIPQLPYGHQDRYCPTQESLSPLTSLLTIGEHRCARRREGGVNWKWWARGFADASVALVLLLADAWGPRSLAHGRFDYVVWALSYWVTVLIVNDVAVAVLGWWFLERLCLQPLKQSHLRWGFSWIKGFSWRRIWTSYRSMSPEVMFDYMMRLNESNQRVGGDGELQTAYTNLRARYYEPEHGRDEAWADRIAAGILTVHEELARVATAKLVKLCEKWDMDQGAVTGREEKRGLHNEYPIDKDNPGREEALVRMADEEFAALLYLGYIRMALIQIRNRIVTASVTYVLLLWALTSYPWMNRHAILLALCLLLGLISAATVSIYAQMHRDDILSRTTETESGKLDPEFFGKVIPTIGIPLLTLIATQFPALSNFIFSWVEPGLKGP